MHVTLYVLHIFPAIYNVAFNVFDCFFDRDHVLLTSLEVLLDVTHVLFDFADVLSDLLDAALHLEDVLFDLHDRTEGLPIRLGSCCLGRRHGG